MKEKNLQQASELELDLNKGRLMDDIFFLQIFKLYADEIQSFMK